MIKDRVRSYIRNGWSAILKMLAGAKLLSFERSSGSIIRASIIHEYFQRTFKIYFPPGSDRPVPKALVIVLHGRGGNGESMILLTRNGINRIADEEGFLVVYPDGIEMNWNDGRKDHVPDDRAHKENIDDVGFISKLIDKMIMDYHADPDKVYITGISNGAIMAYRLACELSDKVTAIAPVAGSMPCSLIDTCMPVRPVSVMAINNTHDPLVPYDGGDIRSGLTRLYLGKVLSAEESVQLWVKWNGCSPVATIHDLPDVNPEDDIKTTMRSYVGCNAEVILYTVHGAGHTWPGGLQYLPAKIIGKTSMDFDANEVIWSFFKKHTAKLHEARIGE